MHRLSGTLAEEQGFGPFDPDEIAAEGTPKRVRARLGREWILDSDRALLAWIEGPTPDYAIPSADVHVQLETSAPRQDARLGEVEDVSIVQGDRRVDGAGVRVLKPPSQAQRLRDHVILAWDAVDAWFVEDERQRGHPRDPYHRIDVHETSRPVDVAVDGRGLAESERALALFETGLPFRFYLPETDVRMDRLIPSETETVCAYKGKARYFHADVGTEPVEDVAWTYPSPEPGFGRLQDRICFHQAKVDMSIADTELL